MAYSNHVTNDISVDPPQLLVSRVEHDAVLESDAQSAGVPATYDSHKARLACPFYKHDCRKYRQYRRSCAGPGFVTVNRLKEHLHRSHRLPKHRCDRCGMDLKSADKLKQHYRELIRCELTSDGPPEGIDGTKEDELKKVARKRGRTQEEKWGEVYSILFPDEQIPSAYYDYPERSPTGAMDCGNHDKLWEFIRWELSTQVRQELSSMQSQENDLDKIVNVVTDLIPRIRQKFQSQQGVEQDSDGGGQRDFESETSVSGATEFNDTPQWKAQLDQMGIPEDMANEWINPDLEQTNHEGSSTHPWW